MDEPVEDEEEAVEPRTPSMAGRKLKRPEVTPHQVMGDAHKRAKFATAAVLAVMLACMVVCFLTVRTAMGQQRVAVLDAAGNLTISPTEVLSQSPGYFEQTALIATNAIFQRSVSGLVLEDLLPVYLEPRAIELVRQDFKNTKDFMERRNLKMYPECRYVSEPIESGVERIVTVDGILTLTGSVRGAFILETPKFSLRLHFEENPDLTSRGKMPWTVTNLLIEVEKDD